MVQRATQHRHLRLWRYKTLWGATAFVLLVAAVFVGVILYRRKQSKETAPRPPTKKTPPPNQTTPPKTDPCGACKPTDMCVGGVCVNDCRENNTCGDQDKFCGANDGACHAKLADGVPCDGSEQCTSGHCVDNGDGKGSRCITPDSNSSGDGSGGDTTSGDSDNTDGGGDSATPTANAKTTNNTSRKRLIVLAVLGPLVLFIAVALTYFFRKRPPRSGAASGASGSDEIEGDHKRTVEEAMKASRQVEAILKGFRLQGEEGRLKRNILRIKGRYLKARGEKRPPLQARLNKAIEEQENFPLVGPPQNRLDFIKEARRNLDDNHVRVDRAT